MSRIALTESDFRRKAIRRQYVPVVSTLLASMLALLPVVTSVPLVPDTGFLVLLAWRLLRPEMWPATTALPLGLFNDLVGGHPLGQSIALWTMVFIGFDVADSRGLYRDYWMDWFFASVAIVFYVLGGWYIEWLMGSEARISVTFPQLAASVLAFPVAARVVLGLDRWRLWR